MEHGPVSDGESCYGDDTIWVFIIIIKGILDLVFFNGTGLSKTR